MKVTVLLDSEGGLPYLAVKQTAHPPTPTPMPRTPNPIPVRASVHAPNGNVESRHDFTNHEDAFGHFPDLDFSWNHVGQAYHAPIPEGGWVAVYTLPYAR